MKTKKMIVTALLIACSFIGANLKMMGTIAFDSMPGFLGALLLGPFWGALIGAAGHFLTALLSGFILTLPIHLEIMCIMAVAMSAFGLIYRKLAGKGSKALHAPVAAGIAAIFLNGPASVALLSPQLLPVMGKAGLVTLAWILTAAATLNVAAALLLFRLLNNKLKLLGVHDDEN